MIVFSMRIFLRDKVSSKFSSTHRVYTVKIAKYWWLDERVSKVQNQTIESNYRQQNAFNSVVSCVHVRSSFRTQVPNKK